MRLQEVDDHSQDVQPSNFAAKNQDSHQQQQEVTLMNEDSTQVVVEGEGFDMDANA